MDIQTLRHSASHILADAVKRLFPGTKLGIGPAIQDGFYYDFDTPKPFAEEDLAKIAAEMKKIVKENSRFEREEISKDEAIKFFTDLGEKYKVELLNEMSEDKVTIYRHGKFVDLCRGPHVKSTGQVKAFKLLSVAGAYWRGTEANPMLQRIYGTAFMSGKELTEHLRLLEEAKKRDHRVLGKELGLFSMQEEWGPGLVFWHPKGAVLRGIIEDFLKKEHIRNGYEYVYIPHVGNMTLWSKSGHLEFYKDYMYSPMVVDKVKYVVKPMNCPGHILIYKSKTRSYRDLPIRFTEFGSVYRYEKSGVLHGLMRVRGFTQDDAHIFCVPEQLKEELTGVLKFTFHVLRTFGFNDYDIYISTMPEKHIGGKNEWELATDALRSALEKANVKFQIDPGEGVFYGPKIDIKIKDALGRAWQCSTIQVDFNLPERFDLEYVSKDGSPKNPMMIHRALLGSLERFMGVLIEHYGGAFPPWLSPIQAVVIPITDNQVNYAKDVYNRLKKEEIRVELDLRAEKMQKKIRNAETQKIPYMIIIGDKEIKSNKIAIRSKTKGDLGTVGVEQFIEKLKDEVDTKKL